MTDKRSRVHKYVDCPRCIGGKRWNSPKKPRNKKGGACLLCNDRHHLRIDMAAAYRLLAEKDEFVDVSLLTVLKVKEIFTPNNVPKLGLLNGKAK